MKVPDWVKLGTPVWYHPHLDDHETRYLGMIDGEPRLLGDTPVVRLSRMEHAYRRAGVPAAAVSALKPVCE